VISRDPKTREFSCPCRKYSSSHPNQLYNHAKQHTDCPNTSNGRRTASDAQERQSLTSPDEDEIDDSDYEPSPTPPPAATKKDTNGPQRASNTRPCQRLSSPQTGDAQPSLRPPTPSAPNAPSSPPSHKSSVTSSAPNTTPQSLVGSPTLGRNGAVKALLKTNDELSQYSIYVDPTLSIPICTFCGVAIPVEHARNHVREHHASQKRDVMSQAIFSSALRALGAASDLVIPSSPIAPIPTLCCHDGRACIEPGCSELMLSSTAARRHFQEAHPGVKPTGHTRSATIHRLFEFRGVQKLVEVDPSLALVASPQSVSDYLKELGGNERPESKFELPSDDRFVSHFLSYTKWGTVVEGFSTTDLISLVALPEKGAALFALKAAAREYIYHIAELLPRVSDTFLLALMGKDECVHSIPPCAQN
jgi:hypothetical protein